jgi:hypothetical protein
MSVYEKAILACLRCVKKANSCQLVKTKTGLMGLVWLVFAVGGCGRGAVSSRWEYRAITLFNSDYTAAQKIDPKSETWVQDLQHAKASSGRFEFDEAELNDLGKDGWELVSCIPEVETIPDAKTFAGADLSASLKLVERNRDFTNIRVCRVTLLFKRRLR